MINKKRIVKLISLMSALFMCLPVFIGCADSGKDTEEADVTVTLTDVTVTDEQTTAEEQKDTETDPDTVSDAEVTASVSSDTDAAPETETSGPETTEDAAETDSPADTSKPADTTTTPVKKPDETTAAHTTEPVTEAPKPKEPLAFINATDKENSKLSEYFVNAHYCAAKADSEGLRITTTGIKSANANKPYIYFKYKDFAESIGKTNVDLSGSPAVVIKLKADGLHDRLFGVTGATTSANTTGSEVTAVIPGGDGWHYIKLDFSSNKSADKISVFKISIEQLAGKDGESVVMGEIRFCTVSEADKLVTQNTYPVDTSDGGLRLLQFNIQTENGNPAPFIVRSEMYRKLVDELVPDVVGMQEVTTTWRKWLDTYVFNDSYAGVGEPRTAGGEANPIYYRKDKYELVDSGTFWLSDTPDKAGSSISGANYPRICTWVVLRDKATGVQFAHMNTHLDHNGNNDSTTGNAIRKEQVAVIVKFAQKFVDMPVFLTGDLNSRKTTGKGKTYAVYKLITGETGVEDGDKTYYLKLSDSRFDAEKTVDDQHTATMTKYYDKDNKAYEPTREPIDYVFYEKNTTKALTYETFLISENGMQISDHLPVFTTFSFKK